MPALHESEPLLGRPGDATQPPGSSLLANIPRGTGFVALLGGLLVLAEVSTAVFTHPLLPLFSPHPVLQSLGVLVLLSAVLVLQPTTAADQASKRRGARLHALLNSVAGVVLLAGVAIIETNKILNGIGHFKSLHAYLGVATAALLVVQSFFGAAMWAAPRVFGGEEGARAMWKYHRLSAYGLVLPLLLVTVVSAVETGYNHNVLHISGWVMAIGAACVIIGVYPRIHLEKLGVRRHH